MTITRKTIIWCPVMALCMILGSIGFLILSMFMLIPLLIRPGLASPALNLITGKIITMGTQLMFRQTGGGNDRHHHRLNT